MHGLQNSMSFSLNNNLHHDPPARDQYLCALNQLFTYNNASNNPIVCNTNSPYTWYKTNSVQALIHENYGGHYAGCLEQVSPTMNVYNNNHYSSCIDTNINHRLNTNNTDVSAHPVVGSIVFVTCGCQLPCRDCNVEVSLADSTPVLCTLDFIESLDITHTCQVVFVHDPRGCSSGIYYMYRNDVNVVCLHVCHGEDLGPFQVIDSKMAKVVFCSRTFLGDLNGDLTPNQVFDDKKGTFGQLSITAWIILSI